MTIIVSLCVALLGALIYAYAGNAKFAELGRIIFFVGMFWFVHSISSHLIRF